MRGGPVVMWAAVSALVLVDFGTCAALGLTFTHWFPFLPAACAIAALGLGYRISGRSLRIAGMANWVLLWLVFSLAGAILSYAVAARGAPWRDAEFAAIDRALGLHWIAWARFVVHHPLLERALALAYDSLMPQIVATVLFLAFSERHEANFRLLLGAFVALLLTLSAFSLMPAIGPWVYYLHSAAAYDFYLNDLQGLHDHSLHSFAIPQLKGIICLPSFHTVLAILLVDAYRRSPLLIPAAILNTLMVLSVPSEGGHYFIDVLAGAAVAGVAIVATGALMQRRRPAVPRAAAAQAVPLAEGDAINSHS